ncbi:hypothetical protein ACVWZN_002327 [Lysobacter sp. HA35]
MKGCACVSAVVQPSAGLPGAVDAHDGAGLIGDGERIGAEIEEGVALGACAARFGDVVHQRREVGGRTIVVGNDGRIDTQPAVAAVEPGHAQFEVEGAHALVDHGGDVAHQRDGVFQLAGADGRPAFQAFARAAEQVAGGIVDRQPAAVQPDQREPARGVAEGAFIGPAGLDGDGGFGVSHEPVHAIAMPV